MKTGRSRRSPERIAIERSGQLGTSGSGNHFVEWGGVDVATERVRAWNRESTLRYCRIVESRGPWRDDLQIVTPISLVRMAPAKIKNDSQLRHLCWLDMDTQEGQEYWLAMNLMGRFASANHEVIHRQRDSTGRCTVFGND